MQIGKVRNYQTKTSGAIFEVVAQGEIGIILAIFNKYSLNTSKHLNFKDFEKAFWLYVESSFKERREELKAVIKSHIANMNRQITDLTMPLNHYKVSRYWLLGYVEGDGSFYFSTSNESLVFSITQKGNETLMLAIQDFFHNLVTASELLSSRDNESWVKINPDKKKGSYNLIIQRGSYLEFVLIPLFDSLTWQSKKYLDYVDWRAIFYIYKKGFNYLPCGKALVKRIISQINNNRLSNSNAQWIDRDILLADIDKLLSGPSNYENKNGKIFIKSLNRFKGQPSSKTVQLLDGANGNILNIFYSIVECAKFLDSLPQTTRIRAQKNTRFLFKGKLVYLQLVMAAK